MSQGIRSFVDQILGKRNAFNYSRTTINRMHLMYWLVGEFYYSDVFSRKVRLLWGTFLLANGLIMLSHCITYIVFTSKLEFTKLLYASEVMLTEFYLLILFPLVSYIYRKDTAEALKILDQFNDLALGTISITFTAGENKFEFAKRKKYGTNILFKVLLNQVGMGTSFFLCSNLHLMIGFTTDKLKEPDYYFYPTYCEQVDTLRSFFILSLSQFIPSIAIIVMALLVPCFSLAATREFYHKFQSISDSLDHQSNVLTIYYERLLSNKYPASQEFLNFQRVFVRNVNLFSKQHRELSKGIAHFRKYLQFSMSASVAMFLYNEILLVYITFVSGSIMTKIKALNMAAGICTLLYVNCLIGRLFSDMAGMFHDSVYNTPWYYLSPKKRKSVYLLLHQTQLAVEFKAVKIYPMNMMFFLRICNYVYSTVNVLRRYIKTRYTS